ncbi:hypothetical protein CRUP_008474 [Coryphaenoides rupestris]|nr:hypothetical protein CRUP_008474 [Coryphaenoides rupestris]
MQAGGDSDSEDDPLDAFMAEVESQAAKDMRKLEEKEKTTEKGIRDDIEEEDEQEAYFRYMAENPTAGLNPDDEDDNIDYDSDGNPIAPLAKKIILPLPPIDHSEIDYPPFERNFYNEHEELNLLNSTQVLELRQKLNLRVSGAAPPKPSTSFAHFCFDEQLMHQIRKSEYTQPTPIQCQVRRAAGKTAAFIWPMLVHIMDQKELEPGEGPIAIIVCPTRELCQQIHTECKRFGKAYSLRSGRLIDHVKKKATSLQRVTYLANEDVTQVVEMLTGGAEKWTWLTRRLVEFTSSGSVLVFVTKKANSEELAANLIQEGHSLGLLHGDMDQSERNKVIADFKKKNLPILVATDVAARGLDIPSIRTVVNYDVARDIDTHTHRIGRTGRAGEKGVAYTLLTNKDTSFAGDLVRNLEGANQSVSKELMDLAMQNPWFRKSRFKGGKGKKMNIGGGGLGYRERPGLGAESSERGGGLSSSSSCGGYEGYGKPPTGAMGDRMSAMKQAFQAQYKNHFVAASGISPKLTTKSSSSSGWTSAGSLSSVPIEGRLLFSSSSMAPPPMPPFSAGTKMAGFASAGSLSSVSGSPSSYTPPTPPPPAPPSPRGDAPRGRYGDDDRDRRYGDDERDRRYDDDERDRRYGDDDNRDRRYGDDDRDRHAGDDRGRHGDGHSSVTAAAANGIGTATATAAIATETGIAIATGTATVTAAAAGVATARVATETRAAARGTGDDWRSEREGGDRPAAGGDKPAAGGDRVEARGEDGFAAPDPPKRKKSRAFLGHISLSLL